MTNKEYFKRLVADYWLCGYPLEHVVKIHYRTMTVNTWMYPAAYEVYARNEKALAIASKEWKNAHH